MEISPEELEAIITKAIDRAIARDNRKTVHTIPTFTMETFDPNEVMKEMSIFDDITEDDMLYWSTPFYDELQEQKKKLTKITE